MLFAFLLHRGDESEDMSLPFCLFARMRVVVQLQMNPESQVSTSL